MSFLRKVWEFIKVVVISLLIILPIRYFIIQPFYVKGASMEPTFHDREYLIINEVGYHFQEPKRGDIVVFRYPLNPQEYFIKRIIGLPGEKININDGKVYVYNDEHPAGIELDESAYLDDSVKTYDLKDEAIAVESDQYFVMGDNRNASKDSRSFGPLDKSFLTGKVWLRGWPFKKATAFGQQAYEIDHN